MSRQVESATAGWCGGVLLLIGLSGCGGYESAYERAVYDAEPVYCYRTVADPDCYRVADPAANRRVVNYYGPSPRRTKPPRPAEIRLDPPPPAEADAAPGGRLAAAGPWERGRNGRRRYRARLRPTPRVWEGRGQGTNAEPIADEKARRRARRSGIGRRSPGPSGN